MSEEGYSQHLRGGKSFFAWRDDRVWGDAPRESHVDWLVRRADEQGDTVFLDFEGTEITYGELERRAGRMAKGFASLGVASGNTVAVMLDNSVDLVVSLFAVNKLGALWVPINTAYRGAFLEHQLADAGSRLLIAEQAYADEVMVLADRLPDLGCLLVRGDEVPLPFAESQLTVARLDAYRDGEGEAPVLSFRGDEIACLIYTSGTTGRSKGCMISHNYLCSIARRRNASVEPIAGGVTWSCLPLFHIASLAAVLVANLIAGERASIGKRFSVSGFWDEIERSGATSVVLLATMLPLIARAPDTEAMHRTKGQIKVITGVPLQEEDKRIWEERFHVGFVNTYAYGQTEANLVTYLPWNTAEPPFGSMGPPAPEFDMMVSDDEGLPVPLGEAGELLLRARQPYVIFSGYWNLPNETLAEMENQWWHTGDLVRMDEAGYLYFVDRKKDYLRSRGENISSFEVESAVEAHEHVAEVAFHTVQGVSGAEEELKATIVLLPGGPLDERGMFEWIQRSLPYFATPRYIEFRKELPKTPTGRVQKSELRKEGVTSQTWDCEMHGLSVRRKV